ncbi:hypothetical protein [Desulfofundulus sp.]|uniref:hypothetical protein n=1 Tax=Desulfofundulus sp. TaxID=2282750 RepID=UPI003C74E631
MRGNLVLIFQEEEIHLLFGRDGIVLAYEQYPGTVQSGNLKNFLCKNGITPADIERVLVVADLTTLLSGAKNPAGYFRLSPAPIELSPVNELRKRKNLKLYSFHLPSPGQPGFRPQLERALAELAELPVKSIAVNSAFSPIDSGPEQKLVETAEKLFPGRFNFYLSYHYNVLNFLLRENALLINTFLLESVKSFQFRLDDLLTSSGISAPLYFLKGDGTLTSCRVATTFPLLTWQADVSSCLLGASWWLGQGDTFVVLPGKSGLKLSITERYLPKLTTGFANFYGAELAGSYPYVINFKEKPAPHKWEETLDALNPFPGPLPLVCMAQPAEVPRIFRYPVLLPPAASILQGAGVLAAPYGVEIEKVFFFSDHRRIQVEKQELWDMALWQLKKDGVELKEISHQFEEIPLRYLPQNACRLRLKVLGRF